MLIVFFCFFCFVFSFSLNDALAGGIYAGEVVEVVGPSAAGKTQLCHDLTVRAICAPRPLRVHWLDTGSAFSVARLTEIMRQSVTDGHGHPIEAAVRTND